MKIDNGSKDIKVSIVIPCFNEEKNIAGVIKQIKAQDYPDAVELIIVDNKSTDSTAEVASKSGALVIKEPKKGTRFAYDAGMKAAKGEIILLTNADVRLPKNWVSTLMKYYADEEIVGVGTHIKFFNCPFYVNPIWKVIKYLGDLLIFTRILKVKERPFWGPSMSCRKWVYKKVHGMNHGTDLNEDLIFTELIRKHGKAPYVYDITVEIDGRRFAGNPIKAIKEWMKGTVNVISILILGKVTFEEFEDIRHE